MEEEYVHRPVERPGVPLAEHVPGEPFGHAAHTVHAHPHPVDVQEHGLAVERDHEPCLLQELDGIELALGPTLVGAVDSDYRDACKGDLLGDVLPVLPHDLEELDRTLAPGEHGPGEQPHGTAEHVGLGHGPVEHVAGVEHEPALVGDEHVERLGCLDEGVLTAGAAEVVAEVGIREHAHTRHCDDSSEKT